MWASLLSPFPQSLGGKDWRSGRWYCWSYEAEDIGEGSQEADGPGGALKCVLEVEDGWVWAGAHGKVAWREPWAFRGAGVCAWGRVEDVGTRLGFPHCRHLLS